MRYTQNSAPRHELSDDGMTLVIEGRVRGGVLVATLHRLPGTGPYTDEDVATALSLTPGASAGMQPGQHNRTQRWVTRYGTLWAHLMLGPPTWWLPKARREADGTVMAGWFRIAVAVKFDPEAKAAAAGGRK